MKLFAPSLVIAGLLLPAWCVAEPQENQARPGPRQGEAKEREGRREGPEGEPHVSPSFDAMWKQVDSNSDGVISPEEFAAMPRIQNVPEEKREWIFKRLDKDQDGVLSREELMGMRKERGGPGPGMQRLWELDTDQSGGISFEEFKEGEVFKKLPPERLLALFQRLDTDGDGQLTPKDRPEPPHRGRDGKEPKKPGGFPEGPPPLQAAEREAAGEEPCPPSENKGDSSSPSEAKPKAAE